MFSVLQELTKAVEKNDAQWKLKHDKMVEEAIVHINFCCSLYKWLLRLGKHLIHEHPWAARSWELPGIKSLLVGPRHCCRCLGTAQTWRSLPQRLPLQNLLLHQLMQTPALQVPAGLVGRVLFRPKTATIIPLDRPLLDGSRDLPGRLGR